MTGRRRLTEVAVVIPVHDEEQVLGACLETVATSRTLLRLARPGVRSSLWIVLDACTDGSAFIAAGAPDAEVVVVSAERVGAARAAGVGAAVLRDEDPATVWVANTDADCLVPPHWLVQQVLLAEAGADAVVGTVVPDPGLAADHRDAWQVHHALREGHPHVHGANLGVRASTYLAAGGFPDLSTGEDHALVDALRAIGACCLATDSTRVTTSARLAGRAPEGFAAYLAALVVAQAGAGVGEASTPVAGSAALRLPGVGEQGPPLAGAVVA